MKLLNRIATVKDDGRVEFEIPGDVEPHDLGAGSESLYNEVVCDEPLDATNLQCIPPLQIVMLIVGTRGDVQPFIAIGKRLQVRGISFHAFLYLVSFYFGFRLTNIYLKFYQLPSLLVVLYVCLCNLVGG